ncbi:hypothetical protein [Streptomyces hoynatensis]|uniref:hypothetical protein n=1 Tax=Streptomyces hoynatensis TaxID=1141874 RepID=UPI0015770E08|nr:hypothetical protein [Streptomyces hoynatensis]
MKAHAELAQVWPRDGRLRLIGHLHGPRPAPGPAAHPAEGPAGETELVLLVALRGAPQGGQAPGVPGASTAAGGGSAPAARPGPLRYPVTLDGREFDAWLPVADLVPARLADPVTWDLWLAPPESAGGRPRLRVGRVLDDIRNKKSIMVFPGQRVSAGTLTAVVRPYYTIKDNLSVEVRAAEPGAAR